MTLFALRLTILSALVLLLQPALSRNISEVPLTDTNIICYEASCNSTTDVSCLCSGYEDIWTCIGNNATSYQDYYTSYRLLAHSCDIPQPIDTIDPDYLGTGVATFLVQTLFFALRIVSRLMGIGKWGWDDHICVLAYITLIGQLIMLCFMNYYGYYKLYWTLDFWKYSYFLRVNFARAETYAIGLGLCKMSILFLYQRVFEGPRLRIVLLVTQAVNVLLILSYVIATCFVSIPFTCQFYLDMPANCTYNDVWDGSGAYSALNAALDVWMVIIPAVIVWRLQMKTTRKISVIAIFATGIVTCLFAIMRFILYRVNWYNLNDTDYQHLIMANFYAYYVELTACFVIACLPAARQLIGQKFWPGFKSRMSTFSITAWTRNTRSAGYKNEQDPEGTKLVSVVISKPVDGSFKHLTSHLHPEEPKGGEVGWAL